MDEYIDLSQVKVNENCPKHDYDKFISENGKHVYQIQGVTNEEFGYIMNVGILNSPHDVVINEFDLFSTYKCIITSCIYDENSLKNTEDLCRFSLIKILICLKKNDKAEHICTLSYNFNTLIHKQAGKSILDYISQKEMKVPLKGFYSILFQYSDDSGKNKLINLELFKNHIVIENIIEELIKWIFDTRVMDILKNISKNNIK